MVIIFMLDCCTQIINLIVTEGLKEMNNSVFSICNAMKYVRSSPTKLIRFRKCVEHKKLDSKLIVVMDIPTKWNSTYLMLRVLLYIRKLLNDWKMMMDFMDPILNRKKVEKKKRIGLPKLLNWVNASVLNSFLENFYEITRKN